jgi:succinate dehydrogenase (ubiquinone) cytochrome b560 subunit
VFTFTGIYAGALGYVALPAVGLGFDGASIISLFASFPDWAKVFSKTLVGLPFWFHTWNGMRHLGWDMGYCKPYC